MHRQWHLDFFMSVKLLSCSAGSYYRQLDMFQEYLVALGRGTMVVQWWHIACIGWRFETCSG